MAVTLKGQTAVYEGTSTDTKPTDADNNAIFKELDTGIRYYYDGTDWNEIPRSGGGGGGGTGTDDYTDLNNKPKVNNVTVVGNLTSSDLKLQGEITSSHKLNPSFINYDATHAAVTESDKTTWSGKQDALTFDGTYSASTNKAATVSTVTNAVNALDVTGDASVAASKTISAWSETDGKVSISTQNIAITGTQATLTGYAKSGTAGQAVAATDNVNQAIGKLEATVDDNKTNISSILDGTTMDSFGDVESALADKVDKETGKGLSTNDYTTAEKTKLAGIAEGAEVNVQSNWTQTTTTADDYIKNKPTLGTAAAKNATDTYNATGTDVTTGKAVAAALATLPEPMVFKGSLGTGGTITTLPSASSSNKGYVYKVITAGTYASQSAKVGDTFISDGSAWVLIPSGDEPSGTVTNVAVANGGGLTVSGSPITSSGTITVGHSNSVTAKTSSSVKKFTYDAYGHVTGSSELSTAESNALASGIDSTKVEQIETNKNNILTIADQTTRYNLLNNIATSKTDNNVTLTVNADKSVTVSTDGAASANTFVELTDGWELTSKYEGCTVSGATIGSDINACIYVAYSNNGSSEATSFRLYEQKPTTLVSSNYTYIKILVIVISGKTISSPITFKPMITPTPLYNAGFTNYQPYAMSNAELTAAIKALQVQLANQ